MQEEKRFNNTVWYRHGDYAFKVNILGGNSVVWISFKGYNLAFPMIIRDFLYGLEEYNYFHVTGFEVKQEEVDLLIGEILNFFTENGPETMGLIEKYVDNEWYM